MGAAKPLDAQNEGGGLSFSSGLVRVVHARQSRAWPFACLAFCSAGLQKKERLLVV